jgi:hypothetical protein
MWGSIVLSFSRPDRVGSEALPANLDFSPRDTNARPNTERTLSPFHRPTKLVPQRGLDLHPWVRVRTLIRCPRLIGVRLIQDFDFDKCWHDRMVGLRCFTSELMHLADANSQSGNWSCAL